MSRWVNGNGKKTFSVYLALKREKQSSIFTSVTLTVFDLN